MTWRSCSGGIDVGELALNSVNMTAKSGLDVIDECAFCLRREPLCLSHSIPLSAFKEMLKSGSGKVISIPGAEGIAGYTSETGAARLLCKGCEANFNTVFDAPLANALKKLAARQDKLGNLAKIEFSTDQMAHALVSVAWRISLSSAALYEDVNLASSQKQDLDRILRLPASEVLKYSTVRIARIRDATSAQDGGFSDRAVRQLIKSPQVFSIVAKQGRKKRGFAIDWTMFGFLVHVIVPRLSYTQRRSIRCLKRNGMSIKALPVSMTEYDPLMDAVMAGYAAKEEGRMSKSLLSKSKKVRRKTST